MTQLPATPGSKVIRQAEVQHWIDGYAFVAAAKAEAQAQIDLISEIREASCREGYTTGFEQGAREAATLLVTTTARVNDYVAGLDQQLVDLSLSIIAKIFGKFDHAEVVARLVQHALQGFQRERDITISVAPEIAEEVSQRIKAADANEALNISVLADPRLSGTKCVLSNAIAVVDAGLETQLSAIREALVAAPAKDGAA
jgi:type III secretion protein L